MVMSTKEQYLVLKLKGGNSKQSAINDKAIIPSNQEEMAWMKTNDLNF